MLAGTKQFAGLLTAISPEDLDDMSSQDNLNTCTDKFLGALSLYNGYADFLYTTNLPSDYPLNKIKSLHNYKHQIIFAECEGALYYIRTTDTSWNVLSGGGGWSSAVKLRSCRHLDKLYFFNGIDRMKYYDHSGIHSCEDDTLGYKIPYFKYAVMAGERMFGVGSNNAIYFSGFNDPSSVKKERVNLYQIKAWPEGNVIYLDNKELLSGIANYQGRIIVTQWENLYILEGLSPATFRKIPVESANLQYIGCVNGDTLVIKDLLYGIDKQCIWATDGNTVKDISTLSIKPTFVSLAGKIPQNFQASTDEKSEWEESTLDNITTRDNGSMSEIINVHRAGMKETALVSVNGAIEAGTSAERWYAYWSRWIKDGGMGEMVNGWSFIGHIDDNTMSSYAHARMTVGNASTGENFNTGDIVELGYIWGTGTGIDDEQLLVEDGGYPKKWVMKAFFKNIIDQDKIHVYTRNSSGGWDWLCILDKTIWIDNCNGGSGNPVTNILDLSSAGEVFGFKIQFGCNSGGIGTEKAHVYCLVPYSDYTTPNTKGLLLNTNLSDMKLLRSNMWHPQLVVNNGQFKDIVSTAPCELCKGVLAYKVGILSEIDTAYVGWEWQGEKGYTYNISRIRIRYCFNGDIVPGDVLLQYKKTDGSWATASYTYTFVCNGVEQTQNIDITPVTAQGIRIKLSTNIATAEASIWELRFISGTITSPHLWLGTLNNAVFNIDYNLTSPDWQTWFEKDCSLSLKPVSDVPTFTIKWATTEAGLTGASPVPITKGQLLTAVNWSIGNIWVQWTASLACVLSGNANLSYPQLDKVNIEGLWNAELWQTPFATRWQERLKFAFPFSVDTGIESLNEGNFTAHTKWAITGGFSWMFAGVANYVATAGTLLQTLANMAISGVGSRWYKFTYTVSSKSGTVGAEITSSFAEIAVPLTIIDGTYTVYFKSAVTPSSFVISATGTGSFSLDDLSLIEVDSYFLIYDRLGKWQKRLDLAGHQNFLTFGEELYGGSTGKLVKWSDTTFTDSTATITATWRTKQYYSPSVMQQLEAVQGYCTIKNNTGSNTTVTITESALGGITSITALANVEAIYPFYLPIGTIADKINFLITFNKDVDIKQFAIELRELRTKEW